MDKYDYKKYLENHIRNVHKAGKLLMPILNGSVFNFSDETKQKIEEDITNHDKSKFLPDEYVPYENHFSKVYAGEKVVQDIAFKNAVKLHEQRNPHHPEYWQKSDSLPIIMPDEYIFEMLCDWWSFNLSSGNYTQVLDFYDNNKSRVNFDVSVSTKIEKSLKAIEQKYKNYKGKL